MVSELFDLEIRKVGRYDEFEMLPYLVREEGFTWLIYGAGEWGKLLRDLIFKLYCMEPDFFVDQDPKADEKDKIYSINELMEMDLKKCFVVISPYSYGESEHTKWEIDSVMHRLEIKCEKFQCFYGKSLIGAFKSDWYFYIKNNAALFDRTYELLADDLSKETYLEFLKIYVTGEPYAGITMPEENKYWGIDLDKSFVRLLDDEVLLSVGACWGDTVYQFLKLKRTFKKVIAVEGNEEYLARLKRNISLLNEGVRRKIQIDNCFLGKGEYGVDKLYINENITLINMDIEGAELDVLRSAEQIIKRNRPVLSICAYHKKEDLIVIPEYIQTIVEDYIYVVRKYPSEYFSRNGFFHIDYTQQNNELVLYVVPRERYIPQ